MRILQDKDSFFDAGHLPVMPWADDMCWPAKWIRCNKEILLPFIAAYRLRFSQKEAKTFHFHVSADERYELFIDGELIGRGPERSDPQHWCYETYEVLLDAGDHIISSRVWSLGKRAPGAQMSTTHGFLLAVDEPYQKDFSTGIALWESREIYGITFPETKAFSEWCTGIRNIIDFSEYSEEIEHGDGENWHQAVIGDSAQCSSGAGHLHKPPYLYPALLPAMMNQERNIGKVKVINPVTDPQKSELSENNAELAELFQQMFDNNTSVEIPSNTALWVLIDLEDYYCIYPEITLSGGKDASISVDFSESLAKERESAHTIKKGNRSEFDGKYWVEFHGDTFIANGSMGCTASPLWFRAGCWMALRIITKSKPLTIDKLRLFETRYPLEQLSLFKTSDADFAKIEAIMMRTLQMCSSETYFDCPYYEQLMYLGDTRLQALITYVVNGDFRLPRKAVKIFDWSRSFKGLTASCYPSGGRQTIPPFSLIWIAMLHDHMMWTNAQNTVKESMPSVRSIIEQWEDHRQKSGLLSAPAGWNFIDWSRPKGIGTFMDKLPRWSEVEVNGKKGIKWDIGTPPDGYQGGISGVLNLFYVYFLSFAIDLEEQFGAPEMAKRLKRLQGETFDAVHKAFYSEKHGMYADNLDHSLFSEHSQCLALLSGLPDSATYARLNESFFSPKIPLAETTYYFSHYYFETCRICGRIDKLLERQKRWNLFSGLGLKTVLEEPEPSRSDCHAWSSHPLFHWYATILGIRPASPGFNTVHIKPQLGTLEFAEGEIPYKNGKISIYVEKNGKTLSGKVKLPENLSGSLEVNRKKISIEPDKEISF